MPIWHIDREVISQYRSRRLTAKARPTRTFRDSSRHEHSPFVIVVKLLPKLVQFFFIQAEGTIRILENLK